MEPLRHHPGQSHHDPGPSVSVEYGPTNKEAHQARRKERAAPHTVRVVIRLLALVVAASIIGVLAHATGVWFTTRDVVQQRPNGIRQRAWPLHIDLWPTWVMLGAAIIAIFIQIVSLLTLCGGVRRLRQSHLHNWTVFFSSAVAIAAWAAAAVYFKLQDTKGKKNWDLWSWSCTHESLENGKMSFETMCVEMNYTFYASVVVAALEIASLAIFGHILRKPRRQGPGYTRITVEQR